MLGNLYQYKNTATADNVDGKEDDNNNNFTNNCSMGMMTRVIITMIIQLLSICQNYLPDTRDISITRKSLI